MGLFSKKSAPKKPAPAEAAQEASQQPKEAEAKSAEPKKRTLQDREESVSFKCEQFFGKNWKYIFTFVCICMLVVGCEVHNIADKIDRLEKVVYENNGKVVLTTADGRAIKVIKEPLKAELLRQYALRALTNNFIVSRAQLTDNFSNNTFKTYSDILKNAKNLESSFKEYFDDDDKVAIGDFVAYLQWLLSAMATDKLPEFLSIKDYTIDKYEFNNNTFKIEISIQLVANSYILAKGKYETGGGVFKIYAEGDYDLQRSTENNPYGMKIRRLKISPVVKGN